MQGESETACTIIVAIIENATFGVGLYVILWF